MKEENESLKDYLNSILEDNAELKSVVNDKEAFQKKVAELKIKAENSTAEILEEINNKDNNR